MPSLFENERPFAEPDEPAIATVAATPKPDLDAFTFVDDIVAEPDEAPASDETDDSYVAAEEPDPEPIESDEGWETATATHSFTPGPKRRASLTAPWGKSKAVEFPDDLADDGLDRDLGVEPENFTPAAEPEPPKLKLGIKPAGSQSELSLDSAPRGRFEGESPNVFEGEDLDLPPFLRKKK